MSVNKNNKELVSRKDALTKMGKYAALTAVGTFLILNPQKAQAASIITGSDTGGISDFD